MNAEQLAKKIQKETAQHDKFLNGRTVLSLQKEMVLDWLLWQDESIPVEKILGTAKQASKILYSEHYNLTT